SEETWRHAGGAAAVRLHDAPRISTSATRPMRPPVLIVGWFPSTMMSMKLHPMVRRVTVSTLANRQRPATSGNVDRFEVDRTTGRLEGIRPRLRSEWPGA